MNGIYLNHFYRMRQHMKLLVTITIGVGALLLVTGNVTLLELFTYIFIAQLSISGVAGMSADAASNWNNYELTLPVRRTELVRGKFLSYLSGVAFATVLVGVIDCAALVLHRNKWDVDARSIASLFSLGIGIAVMAGAFFYLLVYWLGVDKSDSILTISLLAAVVLAVFLVWLVNRFPWHYSVYLIVFNLVHLSLFWVSCQICQRLNRKPKH